MYENDGRRRGTGPELVTVVSIQVGRPQPLGEEGGIFKRPVAASVFVGPAGVEGDGQADLTAHGGPDKAVCVYSSDHFEAWREVPELAALAPGGFGENFTIAGAAESGVCIGDRWRVGALLLEVSQPRQPCWKLARKWRFPGLPEQVVRTGRTGWYLRVREAGWAQAGAGMTLIERLWPEWTVAAANAVMHGRGRDRDAAARLASVDALSESWRTTLLKRTARDPE